MTQAPYALLFLKAMRPTVARKEVMYHNLSFEYKTTN